MHQQIVEVINFNYVEDGREAHENTRKYAEVADIVGS